MKKTLFIIALLISTIANILFNTNGVCNVGCYTAQTTGDIITTNGWQNNQPLTNNFYFKDGIFFIETIWNNDKNEKSTSEPFRYVYSNGVISVFEMGSNSVFYTMDASVFAIKKELPNGTIQIYTNYMAILLQVGFIAIDVVLVVALVLAFKKKN